MCRILDDLTFLTLKDKVMGVLTCVIACNHNLSNGFLCKNAWIPSQSNQDIYILIVEIPSCKKGSCLVVVLPSQSQMNSKTWGIFQTHSTNFIYGVNKFINASLVGIFAKCSRMKRLSLI